MSNLEGWHSRSTPHPSPQSFKPTQSALKLVLLLNAPVEQEGFTLALFEPNVAVDAMGSVLAVSQDDFEGLIHLGEKVKNEVPETGTFRNTWTLDHSRTSQPIDRLLLPSSDDSPYTSSIGEWELKNVASVQGYEKGLTRLKERVAGFDELPEVLANVIGLTREGRDGWRKDGEDKDILKKVRDILGNVW
jgi:hypothetical protein